MDWADKIAAKCLSDGMGDGDTMRLVAEALRAERHLALSESRPSAVLCANDPDRGASVSALFESLADAQAFHAALVAVFSTHQ